LKERTPPLTAHQNWSAAVDWLHRNIPDLSAVIGHGVAGRGEDVAGAPVEVVAVVRVPPAQGLVAQAVRSISELVVPSRLMLTFIEAHRLGWLPPSIFQQSLLWGGTLLWGDPAALRVIPGWRPDQLDPRLALDEVARAEADLSGGHYALAALAAAGALLLAKRRYESRFDSRAAALRAAWPEAPALPTDPAPDEEAAFVARARRLIEDWLFTWEGDGLGVAAIQRIAGLLRRSLERGQEAAVLR